MKRYLEDYKIELEKKLKEIGEKIKQGIEEIDSQEVKKIKLISALFYSEYLQQSIIGEPFFIDENIGKKYPQLRKKWEKIKGIPIFEYIVSIADKRGYCFYVNDIKPNLSNEFEIFKIPQSLIQIENLEKDGVRNKWEEICKNKQEYEKILNFLQKKDSSLKINFNPQLEEEGKFLEIFRTFILFSLLCNKQPYYLYYLIVKYHKYKGAGIHFVSTQPVEEHILKILSYLTAEKLMPLLIEDYERLRKKYALNNATLTVLIRELAHHFSSYIIRTALDSGEKDKIEEVLKFIGGRIEFFANITAGLPVYWGKYKIGNEQEDRSREDRDYGIIPDYETIKEILAKLEPNKFNEIKIHINFNSDTPIALPYGIIGKHAFYIIIENYIRNIQKYHDPIANSRLEINLNIVEDKEDYLKIALNSNSKIKPKDKESIKDSFEKKFIDEETGELNPEAWGFKTMRIGAFLLAGKDFERLDDIDFAQKIIEFKPENNDYAFVFYIRKYKDIKKIQKDEDFEKFLEQEGEEGVTAYTKSLFLEQINEKILSLFLQNKQKLPLIIGAKIQENELKKEMKNNLGLKDTLINWLCQKLVCFEDTPTFEQLFKKWFEKVFRVQGSKNQGEIKVIYKKGGGASITNFFNNSKIEINHGSDYTNADPFTAVKLRELEELNNNNNNIDMENQIMWNLFVNSKILIIDDRLFKKERSWIETLEKKGLYIIPEDEKLFEIVKTCLSTFHFLSIHLGFIEKSKEIRKYFTDENNLEKFPLFIFIHTARGKFSPEILENKPWFEKVLTYHNLEWALDGQFWLGKKTRLVELFMFG